LTDTLGGKTVQDLSEVEHRSSFLFYGEAGIGKTFLACTSDLVPDLRRVLLIDYEGGTLSVAANFPAIKRVHVDKYEELQEIYNDLYLGKDVLNYNTIILDNLSEICQAGLERAAKDAFDRGDKESFSEDDVTRRAYGTNLIRIRTLVRAFRALPVTTIWTAWEITKRRPNGREVVGPNFPGQLYGQIPGMVQNVGRLATTYDEEKDRYVRYLRLRETTTVIAKRRANGLPDTIDFPTMPKIWQHVLTSPPVKIEE